MPEGLYQAQRRGATKAGRGGAGGRRLQRLLPGASVSWRRLLCLFLAPALPGKLSFPLWFRLSSLFETICLSPFAVAQSDDDVALSLGMCKLLLGNPAAALHLLEEDERTQRQAQQAQPRPKKRPSGRTAEAAAAAAAASAAAAAAAGGDLQGVGGSCWLVRSYAG